MEKEGVLVSRDKAKDDNDDDNEMFEFRLFASKPQHAAAVNDGGSLKNNNRGGFTRIRIRSPTPVSGRGGDGGFVVPFRHRSYYFTVVGEDGREWGRRKKKKKGEYMDVAVDGEEVMSKARSTAWVRESP